jgi:Sulfotransferase family
VRVLFVAGLGRSGSTLLDRLLGQVPGIVSVGEAAYVWEMGLRRNRLCGCGEPFHACPFWTEVGRVAFGGWEHVDVRDVLSLRRQVDRERYIPLMLHPRAWPTYTRRLGRYAALVGKVLQAAEHVSGASVVVDSSKFPSSAFVLRAGADLDVRVVHLVRDSRGVAHSWSKRVTRTDVTGPPVSMRRYSAARVSVRWMTHNIAAERLAATGAPLLRVRYEDLVGDPRTVVSRVLDLAGQPHPTRDLSFIGVGKAELSPSHTVHGNPMRMLTGSVAVRADEAWRTQAPLLQRATVSSFTWPMLRRYGYLT